MIWKESLERVPLFRISAKKDTPISDLLRSVPHSGKSIIFWEFSDTHGNTYCKIDPPPRRPHESFVLMENFIPASTVWQAIATKYD